MSAHLLAMLAALLFSTGGAGIKLETFSGAEVVALRSGIAALVLGIWLRGRLRWSWDAAWLAVAHAAMLTLFVNATKLTTSANAIFLQSTAPVYVLLLGPWLLGERLRAKELWYPLVVGGGVALCFIGQPPASITAPRPEMGNLLGALCGVAWALTLVGLRRVERDHPDRNIGMTAVVVGNLLACAASLPAAWPLPSASWLDWSTLAYLGVFQIALAYICLARAFRRLAALDASLILLLEPALNPLWTWAVRGEEPGEWVLVGGAVILLATAAKTVRDTRLAPNVSVA